MPHTKNRAVTFTWSATIEVDDDFDSQNPSDYAVALDAAWAQVQKSDTLITDDTEDADDDRGEQVTCAKCGCDLDENGYCTDPACPYHDWPQWIPLEVLQTTPIASIEAMYAVKKRAAS